MGRFLMNEEPLYRQSDRFFSGKINRRSHSVCVCALQLAESFQDGSRKCTAASGQRQEFGLTPAEVHTQ